MKWDDVKIVNAVKLRKRMERKRQHGVVRRILLILAKESGRSDESRYDFVAYEKDRYYVGAEWLDELTRGQILERILKSERFAQLCESSGEYQNAVPQISWVRTTSHSGELYTEMADVSERYGVPLE